MGIVVNPGARLGDAQAATGWTNTYATARATAEEWLAKMCAEGIADETEREGRSLMTVHSALKEAGLVEGRQP